MSSLQSFTALGLASGSELDGLRAAIITTDGVDVFDCGENFEFPYDGDLRDELRQLQKNRMKTTEEQRQSANEKFSDFCIAAAKEIVTDNPQINLIGWGGHIICHQPSEHKLYQLGDCKKMAQELKIATVGRFRNADILAGGLGAPMSAIYYAALAQNMPKPLAFVCVGGVSTVFYIGQNGELLAYDAGPGNAVINEWVDRHGGMHQDYNGRLAISGKVQDEIMQSLMKHKFLSQVPPKIADKSTFADKMEHLEGLSLEDGAATATAWVAEGIAKAIKDFMPEMPEKIVVCGNGVANPTLMRFIRQKMSGATVCVAEDCGWCARGIEPQAFAFLAVRRCNRMPTSYPFTTGAAGEVIGGEVFAGQD